MNYWQRRFEAIEAMNNKTAKETIRSVTPAFDKAQAQIEKEINAWYARFAKNNEISLTEAKKLLNTRELKEFRWDVEEYIKYGRQNALDQAWMKQLENASARFHISRLEALKIRTQNAAERAFGNELDALDEMAARMYTDTYYHTAYEIQRGLGIGFDVGQIDQKKLDKVLSKPWTTDKMTFSDRIWKSKTQLIDSLHTELTQMCILGKAPDQAIKNIAKRMDVSKGQAGRLVMTEAAYFGSVAQKDCFNDLDVEKYEIVATLDNRTSEICQEMDGKVFDMKDFEAGVTAPPFHVWCRSCTAPWFEDDEDSKRAARDKDGKTYYVPADMKYADWKEQFLDKDKHVDITENGKFKVLPYKNQTDYKKYILPEYNDQHISREDNEVLWAKNGGYIQDTVGYTAINGHLRGLTDEPLSQKCQKTIDVLMERTNNTPFRNDYVGFRKVDCDYLKTVLGIDTDGLLANKVLKTNLGGRRWVKVPKNADSAQKLADLINELVGTGKGTVTDKAFTSVSLCEKVNYFTHYPIQFEIQMPKTTKGLITDNFMESEFITYPNTSLDILGAEVYNDDGKECIRIYARMQQE